MTKTLLAMVVGSVLLAGPALACDGNKDKGGATAEKAKDGKKNTSAADKKTTT